MRPTQIGGGMQAHHQSNLAGASRDATNAVQWLAGAAEITGDPVHQALLAEMVALSRRISVAQAVALANLNALHETDPTTFYAARSGLVPWPDEIADGFEPICSCEWRCLLHVTQAASATPLDCNCDLVCPRHQIPRVPGDREPLLQLPRRPAFGAPN